LTPAIELQDLGVRLGGRPILRGLDVALSGRALGLLGPNGAGKTTLIHTLLGFHRPSEGTARVLGRDIRDVRAAREARRDIGYMPERDAFIHDMSAVRFVRLMGEVAGLPPTIALERAHETLIAVGLGEARYRNLGTYSLGMKQRAKLAQAIVHGPRLLFLDEPTNGLDPAARVRMIRMIGQIRDSGVQIVLSSHLLRDVEQVCEDVLVLRDGQIAVHCDLAAERRANARFLDLEVRGAREVLAAAIEALGATVALPDGKRRLKVVLPEALDVREVYRAAAGCGVQIRRLASRRDSLEDIFLRAMGLAGTPEGAAIADEQRGAGRADEQDGAEAQIQVQAEAEAEVQEAGR